MEHKTHTEQVFDDYADEVKKIEMEAETVIKDAMSAKDEAIADARSEAAAMLGKKEKKIDADTDERVRKEKEKIDKGREETIRMTMDELKQFEKNARKSMGRAADYIAMKVEEKLEEL